MKNSFSVTVSVFGCFLAVFFMLPRTISAAENFRKARPVVLEKTLPEEAGTFSFRAAPRGWEQGDGCWHFFALAEDAAARNGARLMIYQFPNGNLRLLWQESKSRVVSIVSPGRFRNGAWHAVDVTWQRNGAKTAVSLYLDGSLLGSREVSFHLNPALLGRTVRLGEVHHWNPASAFGSEVRDLKIISRCLSKEEIALRSAPPRLEFVTHDAIPETVNHFQALVTGAEDYSWTVRYLDSGHNEIGNRNFVFRKTGASAGAVNCDLVFSPPAQAVTCIFRLKALQESADRLTFASPRIEAGALNRVLPDCYWHGDWIWDDRPFQPGAHRYLRRTFVIEDAKKIESAYAQWLTDNASVLYLNGHRLGHVYSWAVPAKTGNIAKYLRSGSNVLAADGFCEFGRAAFLGELTLNSADGTRYIGSDLSWKVTSELYPGWEKNGFDDSAWKPAVCRLKLGRNPYGLIGYHYFGRKEQSGLLDGAGTFRIEGAKKLSVPMRFRGGRNSGSLRMKMSLVHQGSTVLEQHCSPREEAAGIWRIDSIWHFPADATPGIYEVRISHPQFDFGSSDLAARIEYQPRTGSGKVRAEIRKKDGVPRLLIDGIPQVFTTYKLGIGNRSDQFVHVKKFQASGVNIFEYTLNLQNIWKGDRTVDFRAADHLMEQFLFAAPEPCRILLNVDFTAPRWWLKKNPEERTCFPGEAIDHVAFSSEKYRRESAAVLEKLAIHLEKAPYAGRIIGYFWVGGEDGQWMQWVKGGSGAMFRLENKRLSDYSRPMQSYFRRWLEKKYGNITRMNWAWNSEYRNFAQVQPPSEAERKTASGGFLFPVPQGQKAMDFQQALSDAVTDLLLTYSRTVKKVSGGRKVVGMYYGKMFTISGHNEWAEFGFERLLNDPAVDIFAAPTYFQRQAGRPHAVSAPLATMALHGKMFLDEADLRTYAGGAKAWAYTGNPWDTVNTMRKIAAMDLVENQGIRWYDIHPGEFSTPVIMETVKQIQQMGRAGLNQGLRRAEIAVITSEKSLTCGTLETVAYMSNAIREQGRGAYSMLGTPVDFHLLEDMTRTDFPEYRLYVFVNAWYMDRKLRQAVRRFQKNGAVMVWFHAPGFYSEEGRSRQQIEEITGISLEAIACPETPMLLQSDSFCPFLQGFRKRGFAVKQYMPLHVPRTEGQQTFGSIGKKPAGAWRKYPDWTSVYLAAPVISAELMSRLADLAGCHFYCRKPGSMLYAGEQLFGMHAAADETRTAVFPRPVRLKNLLTGKMENSSPEKEIRISLLKGETRVYRVVK